MRDLSVIAYNLEKHYSDAFGVMQRDLKNKKALALVVGIIADLKYKNPSDPIYAELYEKIKQIEL